jgi:hypothetical protein
MEKNPDPGLNFFDADPDTRSGIFLIQGPGWKNLDPG